MEHAKLSRATGVDAQQECISSALAYDDDVTKDVSIDRCYFQEVSLRVRKSTRG